MTAVEQAEARRRESRSLVILLSLLCVTGLAMGAVATLGRLGTVVHPWPPVMATLPALTALGLWILILAALAVRRAMWLTQESAGVLREMRQRQELIAAFADRASGLAQGDTLQSLYERVLDTALELVGADTGSLMLASVAQKQLTIVAARGLSDDIVRTSRIQFGDRIAGLVAETGRPLLLGPGPAPAQVAPRLQRQHELSSSICVPLLSDGAVIGVLSVNRLHDRPPFTADDVESLAQLARSAEAALAGGSPQSPAATGGSDR